MSRYIPERGAKLYLILSCWILSQLLAPGREILLSDHFDVSEPTLDINAQLLQRQGGVLAPLNYLERPTTAAGQGWDLQTSVLPGTTGGRLVLHAINARFAGPQPQAWAIPNHNFIEGGKFRIEADLFVGHISWMAISFGATTPGQNIFQSDALSLLFYANGNISVYDAGRVARTRPGVFPQDHRKLPIHVQIDVDTANFDGSPATVSLQVDGMQINLGGGNDPLYQKSSGFRGNYISLVGYADPDMAPQHGFDNLIISRIPCIQVTPTVFDIGQDQLSPEATVLIPQEFNETSAGEIHVVSLHPEIAVPEGADSAGRLVLKFPQGGALSNKFKIRGISPGRAEMVLTNPVQLCVESTIQVAVNTGIAVPEILFLDGFQVSGSTDDLNFEHQLRQSGRVAPLLYREAGQTASGGGNDSGTRVAVASGRGQLELSPQGFAWVSPEFNFQYGRDLTISFETHPGADRPQRDLSEGSAILIGTDDPSAPLSLASGFGIQFQNNGVYQVFLNRKMLYQSSPGTLPSGRFQVKISLRTPVLAEAFPAEVSAWINDTPLLLTAEGSTSVFTREGFGSHFISLQGFGNQSRHVFGTLMVSSSICLESEPQVLHTRVNNPAAAIGIHIPSSLNREQDFNFSLRSRSPEVAFPGNQNGAAGFPVSFKKGEPAYQVISISTPSRGRALFNWEGIGGICFEPIQVEVLGGWILNPGFELSLQEDGLPPFWGIGSSTGKVESFSRAADVGLAIPDRQHAVALYNGASLSQKLLGLERGKTYELQFFYRLRDGLPGACAMEVYFEGSRIMEIDAEAAMGSYPSFEWATLQIRPSASESVLEFRAMAAEETQAILIDALTLTSLSAGEQLPVNPSFEASGTLRGAARYDSPISGWTFGGVVGLDSQGGYYADNGSVPDQDNVLYLSSDSMVGQAIHNLEPGKKYDLTFYCNAKAGTSPRLGVDIGGETVLEIDVAPVGEAKPYHFHEIPFTAGNPSVEIVFKQLRVGAEVILLDRVSIRDPEIRPVEPVALVITRVANELEISWTAIGPWELQTAPQVHGPWTSFPGTPAENQNGKYVRLPPAGAMGFFRLYMP